MYIDILKVLAHTGPMAQKNIMSKANFNCNILDERLNFLIKNKLIEERTVEKRKSVFAVTQNGINVLKYFRELEQVPPIIE